MNYLNPNLTPEARADDLLARMRLEEKFAQTQCFFVEHIQEKKEFPHGLGNVSCLAASVWDGPMDIVESIRKNQRYIMEQSPHHIPAIFHVETATGTLMPGAANYPNELARAASFDPRLELEIGKAVGRQTRTCGMSQGLAPVLDLGRDPRMGRQAETYGEDPTLAAAMGVGYVRGIQDGHSIAGCSKHFLGFMLSEGGIHGAKTMVNPRELREEYGKVFQAAITEADLRSAMNSYGVIDGTPAAGNKAILTDLLRGEMGFNGIVVSDYSAVGQLHSLHRVAPTMGAAGEMAMAAGMDCELPWTESYSDELLERFATGKADIEILNTAVRRILTEKFRLGLFENPYPAEDAVIDAVLKDPHAQALSLRSAREALVLLQNDGILPLSGYNRKIAVIGWHGGTTRSLFGCYMNFARQECRLGAVSTMAGTEEAQSAGGTVTSATYPGSKVLLEHPETDALARKCYPGIRSLFEELQYRLPACQVRYAYGYPFTGDDESGFAEALALAEKADVVIVTLGGRYGWTTGCTTGEGIDATHIGLPACQERFLEELAKLHKPTIGLHFDGRPVSSDRADRLNALIECWTPGVHGQQAVADVLLGDCEPTGRLPISIPWNAGQVPVYHCHQRGSGSSQGESICFQTYLDCPHTPRYPFGYGLGYTDFNLSGLKTDKARYLPTEPITVTADVTNTGSRPGTAVVQLYFTDEFASMARPNQELAAFARVEAAPGETKKLTFILEPSIFALLDRDMHWRVEAGTVTLKLGFSSADHPHAAPIEITEDAIIDGKHRQFYGKAQVN